MHTTIRKLIVVPVVLAIVAGATSAEANDACRAVPIRPAPEHDRVVVTGLNNLGQVAGFSYRDGPGVVSSFIWLHGRKRALEPLIAETHAVPAGINDLGQVVGVAVDNEGFVPVIWTGSGPERIAGDPGDSPRVINNRGQIAGTRGTNCLFWRNRREAPTSFGDLGGNFCTVNAINERGEVVGFATAATGEPRAFVFRDPELDLVPNGIPFPGNPAQTTTGSLLFAINDYGLATGIGLPTGDLLVYRRGEGGRLLSTYVGISGVAINNWWTIFDLVASERLVLSTVSGRTSERGALQGGVNNHQLFANDLHQLAWQSLGPESYFCQLTW